MNIQNLSQFKKFLGSDGACVTTIYHENPNFKFLNVQRKVEKLQTNAVKFIGGSWLTFEKVKTYDFMGDKVNVYWLDAKTEERRGLNMTYKLSFQN